MEINNIKNFRYNQPQKLNLDKNKQVSFKGNASKVVVNAMEKFERGGFLVEFLCLDFLGMIVPRTYQALMRNREELGHLNYKAGLEEFLREILSGPPMTFIPWATLGLGAMYFGKAARLPKHEVDEFSKFTKQAVENIAPDKLNEKTISKEFIKNLYNDIFTEHREKLGDKVVDKQINRINRLYERLHSGLYSKKQNNLFTNEINKIVNGLNAKINIDKSNTVKFGEILPESKSIFQKIGEFFGKKYNLASEANVQVTSSTLIGDVTKYSKDIIAKIPKVIAKEGNKAEFNLQKSIEVLTNIAKGGRNAIVGASLTLVTLFTIYSPKIYQRYKMFPGVDGLKEGSQDPKATSLTNQQPAMTSINNMSDYLKASKGGNQ